MYDSVDPMAIPASAAMVAGYIDGERFRWPESAWNRFPSAVKVRIARRVTTNDGHVLDVESGIPTVWPPTQAIVDWVQMRRRSGVAPTIYCNQLNDWAGIRKLFHDAGVTEPSYWVARYNNVRDIPSGAIAKQFANPPLAGGHYDLSVVHDYWPGVDSPPTERYDMELSDEFTASYPGDRKNGLPTTVAKAIGDPLIYAIDSLKNGTPNSIPDIHLKLDKLDSKLNAFIEYVSSLLGAGITLKPSGEITVKAE